MGTLVKGKFTIITVTVVLILCITSQIALVTANAGYQDEFTASTLQTGWTFTNPSGTGSYSLTSNSGYLTITAKQNSRLGLLSGSNQNAPRMLQPVTDGFTITTHVSGSFTTTNYRAGLVLWKDTTNFIALEKFGPNQIIWYSQINGVESLTQPSSGSSSNNLYLKIVKSGNTISGAYSADGTTWTNLANTFTFTNDALNIGLFTFNGDASTTTSSFSAAFDYFRIDPHSTLSVLPEYPVGVFGAAAAIAGAYVFFKAKDRAKPSLNF